MFSIIQHLLGSDLRSASSRSVFASAIARSVERSSMKISSRRMPQIDLVPKFAAQKPAALLQRVERLPRLMAVADDRNVDLAVLQIVADLDAHHRDEPQTRILQLLRDQRAENALNLVIDPRRVLWLLHSRSTSSAARPVRWRRLR